MQVSAREIRPKRVGSAYELEQKKAEVAKKLAEQKEKDSEKVKGIFRYHEVPGGVMRFSYKKYKDEQTQTFELFDGQIYELPRGVAKHLNSNVWYPEYEHIQSGMQQAIGGLMEGTLNNARISKKNHRTSFRSLEFEDLEDNSKLVSVEKVI